MPDIFSVQSNPSLEIDIITSPAKSSDALLYTAGGGVLFGNTLKDDIVTGGNQLHDGNPKISASESPVYKKCDKVNLIKETIKVTSPSITRGLFTYRELASSITDINDKTNGKYYWDEVFTTPVGVFTVGTSSGTFFFTLIGNQMTLQTNDVNIVPKEGDYIIFQKANTSQLSELPSSITDPNDASFTDGFSDLPVLYNTETYQAKIVSVNYTSPAGKSTEYIIVLDKSLTVTPGEIYSLILLNRENTGLQKELFYDTFSQIEVHRDQLLGDPYLNNSVLTKPLGRKNYLNYNNAQYLGLKNLLLNIINAKNQKFIETPFMVFDISDDIKDRFLPEASNV